MKTPRLTKTQSGEYELHVSGGTWIIRKKDNGGIWQLFFDNGHPIKGPDYFNDFASRKAAIEAICDMSGVPDMYCLSLPDKPFNPDNPHGLKPIHRQRYDRMTVGLSTNVRTEPNPDYVRDIWHAGPYERYTSLDHLVYVVDKFSKQSQMSSKLNYTFERYGMRSGGARHTIEFHATYNTTLRQAAMLRSSKNKHYWLATMNNAITNAITRVLGENGNITISDNLPIWHTTINGYVPRISINFDYHENDEAFVLKALESPDDDCLYGNRVEVEKFDTLYRLHKTIRKIIHDTITTVWFCEYAHTSKKQKSIAKQNYHETYGLRGE